MDHRMSIPLTVFANILSKMRIIYYREFWNKQVTPLLLMSSRNANFVASLTTFAIVLGNIRMLENSSAKAEGDVTAINMGAPNSFADNYK